MTSGDVTKNSVEAGLDYAEQVASGQVLASKLVKQGCARHLKDLETGASRGLSFDYSAAERVIRFFRTLKHSRGEWGGKPFVLEPWQCFILLSLFGWKRADGSRRFREGLIEIARKNGKSTFFAGIGLYLMVGDAEPGAEVYSFATTKDQAKIVWEEAARMVQASAALQTRVRKYRNNLNAPLSYSKFEPLASNSDKLDGLNTHGGLADELHEHVNRNLWDVIEESTVARRQSLMLAITTAGFDRQSFCYKQHEYAEKVLTGVLVNDGFFAFIASLDAGDNWEDERTWYKANPNLGVSVKLDKLREKALRAKEDPTALNNFLRKHLNRWTAQETAWLPLEKWQACAGLEAQEALKVSLKGRPCYGGLDLAQTQDLNAFVLVFPPYGEDPFYRVLAWFFVPSDNIEKRVRRDRVPYDVWSREGFITATEGNVTDYDVIRETVRAAAAEYEIKELGFDPYNATQIVNNLQAEGVPCVAMRQGFLTLNAPSKELLRLVLAGELKHGSNPVLDWCASNAMVETDSQGNIKPSKKKATERIDGVVALVMGLGRATAQPVTPDLTPEIFSL